MEYALKHFFEQNNSLKKCYETSDGVLHINKRKAQKWAKDKKLTIIKHINPALAIGQINE
jgi:hypothetical protein